MLLTGLRFKYSPALNFTLLIGLDINFRESICLTKETLKVAKWPIHFLRQAEAPCLGFGLGGRQSSLSRFFAISRGREPGSAGVGGVAQTCAKRVGAGWSPMVMTEHIEASVALYLAFTQEPCIGSRVCIRASAYQFVGQKVTPSVLFGKLGNCTHRPLRAKYNRGGPFSLRFW